MVVVLALVALYSVLDIIHPVETYGVIARWVWVAVLAGAAALQRDSRARAADLAARFVGLASGVCATLLVASRGGADGIYLGLLLGTPFVVLILVPDLPSSAFLAGVATTAGGMILLRLDHRPLTELLEWMTFSGVMNALAGWGTLRFARSHRREVAATRARAEALRELRATNERLAKSERLAALGTLAAGMAHEINNPLSYVKANLCWMREAVREEPLDRDELARVLAESEGGAERIARIVGELSAYVRAPVEPAPTSVPATIDDALRLVSARLEPMARVTVEADADLPHVTAVGRHLSQALVNLLVNAAEAVESRRAREPGGPQQIRVRARRDRESVVVSVEDSGDGIRDVDLAHLFEPFFTTKPSGTGLGLAISRENLLRFGAPLDVERSPLGGALFRIRLRCADAASAPEAVAQRSAA